MATNSRIQIGILSPATPNRPHFRSLDGVLPPGVSIAHEGLGLLGESYQDLAGKEDVIVARARELVNKHKVAGLMLTGGFVTLFNPGYRSESCRRDRVASRQRDFLSHGRSDGVRRQIGTAHDAVRSRFERRHQSTRR